MKISRIAIFYQDDAYGRAGLSGFQKAMDKRGMKIVAEGTYERNTTAIKTALLGLRKAAPEAVVMVGAYKPCAEFIKLARKIEFNPVFVNISFVGASALAKELGTEGAGVIVSQVVPFPWDASIKVIADYHAAMKAKDSGTEPEFVSLEGYLVGRLAIAALEKAGPNPTRAGLLQTIKDTGVFDIGGLTMTFGANDNEGLDKQGFSAFGRVVKGMEVVDRLYGGYGEAPDQGHLHFRGDAYLEENYPKLDRIKAAFVIE